MAWNMNDRSSNSLFMLISRVNEVALMCSEFTAYCSHLSSDWLGVLKALCCSSVRFGYTELLSVLDVSSLIVKSVNPGCVRIGLRTLGFSP